MENARKFLEKVYRFEKAVAVFAFSVMTLVIIADVIIRKLVGVGIAGAMRIAVYAMIVTALISFGLASQLSLERGGTTLNVLCWVVPRVVH